MKTLAGVGPLLDLKHLHPNLELSRVQGPLHGALNAKFMTMMFKTVWGDVVLTIHRMKTSEREELMMQDLTWGLWARMIHFMPHRASSSCFRFLGLPFSIAYYRALLPLKWPLTQTNNLFNPSSKCNYLQARELQHSDVGNNRPDFRAIKACSHSQLQCKDQAVIQHNAQYREHHQLPRTIRFQGKVSRLFSMLKISILISFSPNLTDQQDASGVRGCQRVDPSAPVSHPGCLVSLFICFSLQKLPNFLPKINSRVLNAHTTNARQRQPSNTCTCASSEQQEQGASRLPTPPIDAPSWWPMMKHWPVVAFSSTLILIL